MTVRGATVLGIGAMIGAGIFALLGEAGAIAGSAVWISFLLGGIVASLLGYVCVKLGTRYPSCLLYTSPSPRDRQKSRMPSSA